MNRRDDVPLDQMQIDRLDSENGETHVNIVPRGDYRWRVYVIQRKQFAVGGWKTHVSWTGGGQDNDPDAFLEALQKAIEIRGELRAMHPDGSLDNPR